MTIDVVRREPPEIKRCSAEACQRLIEWVRTMKNGRRMPVDHPLRVESVAQRDGTTVSTIDASATHFSTCVAAASFKRRGRRGLP